MIRLFPCRFGQKMWRKRQFCNLTGVQFISHVRSPVATTATAKRTPETRIAIISFITRRTTRTSTIFLNSSLQIQLKNLIQSSLIDYQVFVANKKSSNNTWELVFSENPVLFFLRVQYLYKVKNFIFSVKSLLHMR